MQFVKAWCEGIIVAIVISIIIEMILPEGNNKKYVKVVIGIYIIFTILSPIVNNLNKEIDFSEFFKIEEVSTIQVDENGIKDVYIEGIKLKLKEEVEGCGFEILNLEINFDKDYENIEKIILKVRENGNNTNIKKVEINQNINCEIDEKKINELKDWISINYEIAVSKIFIE